MVEVEQGGIGVNGSKLNSIRAVPWVPLFRSCDLLVTITISLLLRSRRLQALLSCPGASFRDRSNPSHCLVAVESATVSGSIYSFVFGVRVGSALEEELFRRGEKECRPGSNKCGPWLLKQIRGITQNGGRPRRAFSSFGS